VAQTHIALTTSANQQTQSVPSSFFVIKVHREKAGPGCIEWKGEILEVDSNTVSAFDDWPDLVDFIADALNDRPFLET